MLRDLYLNSHDKDITELNLSNFIGFTVPPGTLIYNNLFNTYVSQFTKLEIFYCCNNKLTSLYNLPNSLQELYCHYNLLTSLPNLPYSLQELYCHYNLLTSLPDNLPDSLQELFCSDNQLASLPSNLPSSLQILQCDNNPNTTLYPNLNFLQSTQDKIKYIQQVNMQVGIQRCKEWLAIVNQHNVFLELYERKRMHPNNFTSLLEDENKDINEFIEEFIDI